ncbi:hypothetical protein V7O66_13985 [Methanolobus sp. ZRKC3]|uniref:hypothetical protein n=1 Tax=Methanolobus sp. ZRKC3 TaxID=3125786 RepID=UPI00324638CB
MSDELSPGGYDYLFTTTDCIGEKVALKRNTFSEKILLDHTEITPDLIKEGVEKAHLVKEDKNKDGRRNYFRMIPHPVEGRDDFTNIKVVVEETNYEYDEVVTCYIRSNLKGETTKGEIIHDAGSASENSL